MSLLGNRRRYILACSFGVGLALEPALAAAQTLPSVDMRTWTPSPDARAGLMTEPVTSPGPWNWNVGAYVSYAHRPVGLELSGTDQVVYRPVKLALMTDVVANVGLGDRASVGLDVPVLLYQQGTTGLPSSVSSVDRAPHTGIGDMGIRGKATLVDDAEGGFGLAAIGGAMLPTGERTSYVGDGSLRASVRLLAEYTFLLAGVQGSLGYTLRTDRHTWPDASVGGVTFGDEIPWSFGVNVRPGIFKLDADNRQVWELGAHGTLPAGPSLPFGGGDPGSARLSPVLLGASDRVELGHYHDTYLLGGLEVGATTAVGTPAFRAVAAVGWAPREHDQDHDGVPDDLDQCPEIPEDRDGFEDQDGCPEIDNDDDGIVDTDDRCPNVAGVAPDGCPGKDSDKDGVIDAVDACPKLAGMKNDDPKLNGCPLSDRDKDGVLDAVDKCPNQPEDKDGFQDEDGCPDPDDDFDGVPDKVDACPRQAGEPSSEPAHNGCPNPDRDGDTFDNDVDQCPDAAEVWNGFKDDDGCPDEGGKALVTIDPKTLVVTMASPIKIVKGAEGAAVDPTSEPSLRALATELNRHREWTLGVGARPASAAADAQKAALERAVAVTSVIVRFTHRDGAAEALAWDAVKQKPGAAATGLGMVILPAPLDDRPDNAAGKAQKPAKQP